MHVPSCDSSHHVIEKTGAAAHLHAVTGPFVRNREAYMAAHGNYASNPEDGSCITLVRDFKVGIHFPEGQKSPLAAPNDTEMRLREASLKLQLP